MGCISSAAKLVPASKKQTVSTRKKAFLFILVPSLFTIDGYFFRNEEQLA
jgi:hypothetical protein